MSDERIRLLLGGAALVPLVDRMVQRVRRGMPLTGAVSIRTADPDVRAAIAALLGRPIGAGVSVSVRLEEVDRVVRATDAAPDLLTAVTVLRGPIPVTADVAEADRERWERVVEPAVRFGAEHPDMAHVLELLIGSGRLRAGGRSADAAAQLVRDLVRVLEALPASGQSISAFSAIVLDSAHALDRGPLRSLVETVLDETVGSGGDRMDDRWAMVGIAPDATASTVLVHALRFDRLSPAGRVADDLAQLGRPHLLTLGQLVDGATAVADQVFVCENPSVITAAADRFGAGCRPIVCVRGQPSAATQRLLVQLADVGATLRYHGDFDWGGVRIANRIMAMTGAEPWRFRSGDLLAGPAAGAPLAGTRIEASWDVALAAAIETRGMRLEEEQVLETLLQDLVA